MRDRGFRRQQKERFRKKTKEFAKTNFSYLARDTNVAEDEAENFAKHNSDNRKPCSCYACCNPRRTYGKNNSFQSLTRQEKIQVIKDSDEFNDECE